MGNLPGFTLSSLKSFHQIVGFPLFWNGCPGPSHCSPLPIACTEPYNKESQFRHASFLASQH